LTLLFCAFRYGLSYFTLNFYSRWAKVSYRTAFIAAAATYGIVVFKAYRARARAPTRQQGGAMALAGDENVQYLGRRFLATFSVNQEPRLMNGIQLWHLSGYSLAKYPLLSCHS